MSDIHPTPSERARELVRGGYDTHIHIAPDVVERRITDVELAKRFKELGLLGFGLKSHYTSTAERARVVSEAVPGISVIGAITLNRSVGGLNPTAVEIHARSGGRIVWFPTVSSENEQHEVLAADPDGKVPVWVKFELSIREAGITPEPVAVVNGSGELLPEARAVLEVIARNDLVLATGHLARDEIFTLVDGAVEAGVRTIVVTHPEFPSQRISPEDQVAARGQGRADGARVHHSVYGQVHVGADLRGHACGGRGAHRVGHRPGPGIQPAGGGWSRADGGPVPRRGILGGGGSSYGGREHAEGCGSWVSGCR